MVPPQLAFGGSIVYMCLAVHQALLLGPSYHIKSLCQRYNGQRAPSTDVPYATIVRGLLHSFCRTVCSS